MRSKRAESRTIRTANRHRSRFTRPRGFVLIVVLVAITVLSLGAYAYSELMLSERQAAVMATRGAQARSLADSGLDFVQTFVAQGPTVFIQNGGIYDNPGLFQGQIILDDGTPRGRGRFTIIAPSTDSSGQLNGLRYGLETESTRLNLNTLLIAEAYETDGGLNLLMALPGMTQDVAEAILDWVDPDSTPREQGAEAEHYGTLDPPYSPKNGPLETVEELLLIRGVTPALLFGGDVNRNGMIDPSEASSVESLGIDASLGDMSRGWSAYLTLHSAEANLNPQGQPKINLNSTDLEKLAADLEAVFPPEWVTFIIAYRQSGPYTGTRAGKAPEGGTLDLTRKASYKLKSVLELIGARTQARLQGERQAVVLESPFPDAPGVMNTYLPALWDNVAANAAPIIPGRININQAPRPILLGIPGMTEEIADEIISRRTPEVVEEGDPHRHETWIMSDGIVTLDEMKDMVPYITCTGSVYRVQVVGYFDEGGPAARIEAIVDATGVVPRIVFWRDLSHLGRGYALETLGQAIR